MKFTHSKSLTLHTDDPEKNKILNNSKGRNKLNGWKQSFDVPFLKYLTEYWWSVYSVVWQIPEFFLPCTSTNSLSTRSFFFPFTKFCMLEWFKISSCSVTVWCSSLFLLPISLTRQYSINYTENVVFPVCDLIWILNSCFYFILFLIRICISNQIRCKINSVHNLFFQNLFDSLFLAPISIANWFYGSRISTRSALNFPCFDAFCLDYLREKCTTHQTLLLSGSRKRLLKFFSGWNRL